MNDLSLKIIKDEYKKEREKTLTSDFSIENFQKRNEEKLQKIKKWKSTQKFVSSFEDYLDGDKND